MEYTKAEIESQILDLLNTRSTHPAKTLLPGCGLQHGTACALGTCHDNVPRVTPIDFFNDGLDLWMIGDPGGKIANIKSNPNVAVGIFGGIDHAVENRSLQIWGQASLVTQKSDAELFTRMVTDFGLMDALQRGTRFNLPDADTARLEAEVIKRLKLITLIRVTPQKIILLISRPNGTRDKLSWQ
jgi:hypothetical protein